MSINSSNELEFSNKTKHNIFDSKDFSFKIEPNLGLALPFQHYNDEKNKNQIRESKVTTTDTNGNIMYLEVSTQSEMGPLQALDYDVLMTLLSMAVDQKNIFDNLPENKMNIIGKHRVLYTYAEVSKRLGIADGNRGRIKASIEKIISQKVAFKNYAYIKESGQYFKSVFNTSIILSNGSEEFGFSNSEKGKEYLYVDFEPMIMNNLLSSYHSVIDHKKYLDLTPGSQRRILVFLFSKRKNFGDTFIFDIDELAIILGINNSSKKRYWIGDYLKKIQESNREITFSIKKNVENNSYNVFIKFDSNLQIVNNVDVFWANLIKEYGEENLKNLDIEMCDILQAKSEFDKKYKKKINKDFIFRDQIISVGEFTIDLTLYQVIYSNYKLTKGFKGLASKILSSIIEDNYVLPNKYRAFLYDRVKEKEKNEVELRAKEIIERKIKEEREDEERFNETFNKLYYETLKSKPQLKEKLRPLAVEELSKENIFEGSLLFESEVELKMLNIAKKFAKDGKWEYFTSKFKNNEIFIN